ncbi:hypothetical protein ACIBL5_00505 [Streptomyces sp. NPDC050516]|uniref:hypothetical protein n=1 Tax=Streptomyces sp. NPDC050516 TaxID=3365621 RepID=UPI0037A50FDA
MSPMWDQEDEHASGVCAACQKHTDNGIVRWLPRMSAPDVRLIICADPDACSASEFVQPTRIAHFVQPAAVSRYL